MKALSGGRLFLDCSGIYSFESSFLKRYAVDDALLEEIRNDEIALLHFGLNWLKWLLFKEGDFQLKTDTDAPV